MGNDNELQKQFEEMEERLTKTIKEQNDTLILNRDIIKGLQERSKWKPVEEGLPEDGQKCAIVDIEGFELIGVYKHRYNSDGNKAKHGCFMYNAFPHKNSAVLSDLCVVKWMEIPK